MPDIIERDIRRLDGGLLLIFRELIRTRRTTAAAARLGLSQSAVSHCLGRLRDVFADPLFLRRPHGLEPTPRALELAPRIEALIDMLQASLAPGGAGFDPGRTRRRFDLGLTEYAVGVVTGPLLTRLRAQASGVSVVLQFMRGYLALNAVRRGLLDLAIGRFGEPEPGLRTVPLYEDRYCVVARADHPWIADSIDEAGWRRAEHVFVAASPLFTDVNGPAIGEDPMPPTHEANAICIVPRWETALQIVAGSDAIATGSRRLAEQQAGPLGLKIVEPDMIAPPWTVTLTRRDERDPALDWFCDELAASLAGD
jgi:LysR family transcriptional activator of mexEF-oprN operon